MAKSKVRKSTKKNGNRNNKISYVEKIISSVKNKSKRLKIHIEDNKSIQESLNIYVDELLQSVVFELEEQALNIQNEELDIASEVMFEQYESELETLEEVKKVLNEEFKLEDCANNIVSKLPKKIDSINYLSQKTYNTKPKEFICKVVRGIFDSDAIIRAINSNVPKPYFEYVYTKFFEKLEEYHTEIIQVNINKVSVEFSTEVESLNRIVEEIEEILKTLANKELDKKEFEEKIDSTIKIIKNNNKLRGTYKVLQEFAISLGFIADRQRGTSHLIFKKGSISVPIPNKRGDVKPGLLSAIIKQLGSNREEFIQFNI